MRAKLETAALLLTAAALAAFAISFALGIRASGDDARVPAAAAPPAVVLPPPVTAPLARLEVLNASGRPGAARVATERLRAAGFDVVFFGNAPAADSSAVLDRVNRPDLAHAAAQRAGITRVIAEVDSTLLVDATVLLGADWAGTPRTDTGARAEEGAPWWRRIWSRLSRR